MKLNIWLKIFFKPDSIRRKRQELLDEDYVEVYKGWTVKQYVMVARGTGGSHKVGVFDTSTIKLCVPIKYDELEWIENGKEQMLKGILNGYPVIIDVNGNQYN